MGFTDLVWHINNVRYMFRLGTEFFFYFFGRIEGRSAALVDQAELCDSRFKPES